MRLVIRSTVAVIACLALFQAASASAATLPAGTTAILSGNSLLSAPLPAPVSSSETKSAAVSQNGRFVAFQSQSDGLYDGDDDRVSNVYVRDRVSGALILASRATGADGEPSHSYCYQPVDQRRRLSRGLHLRRPAGPGRHERPRLGRVRPRPVVGHHPSGEPRERARRGGRPGLVEPVL